MADPIKDEKLHVKPTKEELEANAIKALEEAEALKAKADEDAKKDPKQDPKTPEPEPKKDPEPEPKKDPEPDPDEALKKELAEKDKKLKASSREAQILFQRNKQVQEAIEKASSLPDPTVEELKSEYSEWEDMTEFEQRIAKESLSNKRRMDEITKVNKQFKDLEEWVGKVDAFIDDPATIANNPALDGAEDDFKAFASLPTRRGVAFDILVSSFLYQRDEKPARSQKSQMFPQGNSGGGEPPKPKSDKISVSEARILRETNYAEYKRLLSAGKIEEIDL